MKINLSYKENDKTEINVYMPFNEAENIFGSNYATSGKEYRIKRTMKISLSQQQCKIGEKIIEYLYKQYNFFKNIYFNTTNSKDFIIAKIKNDLSQEISASNDSTEFVENIITFILPIIFDNKNDETTEITSKLHSKYNLDSNKDIVISTVGTFGYGKTTLIKRILGFDDTYKFLLVDNGRTTLFNTIIRAFIFNSQKDLEDKEYTNKVELYSAAEAYQTVILPSVIKAFKKFFDDKVIETYRDILKTFISNQKANLDCFFGKLESEDCNIKNDSFYHTLITEFINVKNELQKNNMQVEDINFYDINNNSSVIFNSLSEIKNHFIKMYRNICDKLSPSDDKTENTEVNYTFSLNGAKITNKIDKSLSIFTDNQIKGGSLRCFVKEMYIEIFINIADFGDTAFSSKEKNDIMNYNSLVFVDTVGSSHQAIANDTSYSIPTDQQLISNYSILNESDIILLLEKATNTMSADIKNQIFTLESMGLKRKIIICYSFYNQFVKMDMTSDKDREDELDKYFNYALGSIYDKNPNKAKMLYDMFTNTEPSQIIYLKGLIPRIDTCTLQNSPHPRIRNRLRNKNLLENDENINEDTIAQLINKGLDDGDKYICELLYKIVAIKKKNDSIDSIKKYENIKSQVEKDFFIAEYYSNVFNNIKTSFLEKEKNIYCKIIPRWNTTQAFCSYVSIYSLDRFVGNSIILEPLNDVMSCITRYTSEFFEYISPIDFSEIKNINELQKSKLLDIIKEQLQDVIRKDLKNIIIIAPRDEWRKMSLDVGMGVQKRRCDNIYKLLSNTIDMMNVANLIFKDIQNITLKVIDDTKKSIQKVNQD